MKAIPLAQKKVKTKKRNRLGEHQTLEEVVAEWSNCIYYMPRKNRLCNLARAPGSMYCGTHRPDEEHRHSSRRAAEAAWMGVEAANIKRVPCPLDPNHSVYEHELAHHIQICNVKRREESLKKSGYYVHNCNTIGNAPSSDSSSIEVNADELLTKIKICYDRYVSSELTERIPVVSTSVKDIVLEAVAKASTSFSKMRHALQDAHLSQEMSSCGLLTPKKNHKIVIVELGAGI